MTLTPQLQQSIRLLQLSTLDLEMEISQALADNPLLERVDQGDGASEGGGDSGEESPGNTSIDTPRDEAVADSDYERGEADPLGDSMTLSSLSGSGSGGNDYSDDDLGRPESVQGTSLRDHLLAQLGVTRASDRDKLIASLLIDEIDHNGYLASSLDEIATWFDAGRALNPHASGALDPDAGQTLDSHSSGALNPNAGQTLDLDASRALDSEASDALSAFDSGGPAGFADNSGPASDASADLPNEASHAPDIEELRAALALIQSFDPAGVGAEDLSDCLCLQLRTPPAGFADKAVTLAREICKHHLPLLATGNAIRLRDALQCDEATLKAAHALILRLDPRPGRAWTVPAADYAVPDVVVRRTRQGWRVSLNNAAVPRLRVNALYAQMLGNQRASQHAGLQSQLQQAKWMIRNVEQRFDTIMRVSQAIVDRQSEFFSQGPQAMRPLILKDIASELGMHESTISRATTQKYMLTPFGTLELKFFFGSSVATDSGDTASATAVQAFIRKLVESENSAKPLSDNAITKKLAESGIVIARRTVAKYRESLRIAPAALRRAHAAARKIA